MHTDGYGNNALKFAVRNDMHQVVTLLKKYK
jgi:hypothetical protein